MVLVLALVSACGVDAPAAEWRPPLSQRQCDDALAHATVAVEASADRGLRDQAKGEPIRLTEVWQACGDPD